MNERTPRNILAILAIASTISACSKLEASAPVIPSTMVLPTATFSPTATETPRPTATPRPAPIPEPTDTSNMYLAMKFHGGPNIWSGCDLSTGKGYQCSGKEVEFFLSGYQSYEAYLTGMDETAIWQIRLYPGYNLINVPNAKSVHIGNQLQQEILITPTP